MGQMTLTATCGHAVAYEFEGEPNPNKVARIVGRKCQACRVRAGEEHNRRNRMEAIARRGDAPPGMARRGACFCAHLPLGRTLGA